MSNNKPVEEQTVNDLHTNVTSVSSTISDFTPISTKNSTIPSNNPISARTLAQRARREREKNITHDKPVQEKLTTQLSCHYLHPNNTAISSLRSDSTPISARVLSQHAIRETENNLVREESFSTVSTVSSTGLDSKVISARTLAQRARREREKASSSTIEFHNKRKRVESNPICGDQFNKRKLAQRARRQREKGIAIYSMTANQLHSTVLQQPNLSITDKGKNKVIEMISTRPSKEIIYFVGSSSTGNANKEHEVHRVEYIEDPEPHQNTYMEDVEDMPPEHEESEIIFADRHSLGEMTFRCEFCDALHWLDEKLVKSSKKRPRFGTCCHHGKIKLPPPVPLPPPLHALFEGNDARSKSFRQHKRSYNAANAFTSLGVQLDDRIVGGHGPRSFSIHGELHHRVGTLLPDLTKDPVYSQLYMYDCNAALDYRQGRNPHLRRDVLKTIQDTLLETNELCKIYKQAFEVLSQNDDGTNNIFARLHYKAGTDRRRYNVPTSKEIAVVLPGDGLADQGYRDIILHMRNHGLKRIHECHPLYLPSHYVLFFPHGELGWSPDLTQWDITNNCPTEDDRLTQLQYHAYQLYERDSIYSPILRGGNLFEEYIVDAYAAYDQNRLHYVYQHQDELRSEASGGLADMVNDGHNPNEIGQRFILPSSHPGSPRHMYELYQDAMAITRHYKHPDIFLTVTANPNWPEIKKKLKPDETVTDRPDLVARVFELKRKAIMKEIIKKKVFGKVAAYVYTIEFQKRGLPHMHALLFLKGKHKITTAEQVDKIISAEIPDAIAEPALFQTVMKCMIHGPCGENNNSLPCMQNPLKKCSAKYPRKWNPKTNMDVDGYPNYMRRENGKTYKVRGCEVDNRDVVPYNPHLSRMFNCHINVEVCSSVRAVKYITKYIHKGFDRTTMVLNGANNEIQIYIDGRYIGAPEAAWRLFQFAMHAEDPNVVRLALHLPGMHHVVYNPNDTREQILAQTKKQASTLMGFFKYCRKHRSARKYTYQEFPQHYVWKKDKREWKKRKQGRAIGRLYFAAPNSGERFYLRLLLTSIKGPTSFKNLRTFKDRDGIQVTYNTFKEAWIARGLLEDDEEWEKCLEEAALMKTGYQLRRLFCIILLECSPTSPEKLWSKFALKISDDVPHILRTRFSIENPTDEQAMDYGLFLLEKMLEESGKYLSDFPGMPQPMAHWETPSDNPLIWEQLQYQYDQPTQNQAIANITRLNEEQLNAYNLITDSAINGKGKMFFLNGPAGTGKTFVYNSVAATCRSKGKIVIMVASSGIAAILLNGGRTAHSALKIPLQVMEDSVCTIPKHSEHATLLKEACLIIWDEVPMQHRHCVEAVERTLRDIRNDPKPFGGITMVLGRDFRQTLPVIPRALREEVVAASVRRSFLWKHVQVITLVKNMRLDVNDQEKINFAEYLMEVGSKPEEDIQLPLGITTHNNVDDIISTVYPQLNSKGTATNSYLTERTILSARNEDVSTLNNQILQIFPGDVEEFLSADKIVEDGDDMEGRRYPTELLNAQNHPSMPPFKLRLKKGCPIMLLRNIAPKDGLCNGTRLKVLQCRSRVIEAQIFTGNKAGNDVLIPRLTISPTTKELPFKMSRRQFPVRLAFAMTINKSQGQSVKYVGIDLRTPVFSHGQLYVALSRCTSAKRISIILPPDSTNNTTNVVYPEVLL